MRAGTKMQARSRTSDARETGPGSGSSSRHGSGFRTRTGFIASSRKVVDLDAPHAVTPTGTAASASASLACLSFSRSARQTFSAVIGISEIRMPHAS